MIDMSCDEVSLLVKAKVADLAKENDMKVLKDGLLRVVELIDFGAEKYLKENTFNRERFGKKE